MKSIVIEGKSYERPSYSEPLPGETTEAFRARGRREALQWFGSLTTGQRGEIIEDMYLKAMQGEREARHVAQGNLFANVA